METRLILEYLRQLGQNNNREWYREHKSDYEQAKEQFLHLIEALQLRLGRTEPGIMAYQPGELIFRLTRDTRFSRDKSPYNPCFRAHISQGGRNPVPVGYFLVLKPGESFLGGGLFADVFREATTDIRDAIAAHGDEWDNLIHEESFRKLFELKGTALKKVPAGYDPTIPQAAYLKYKSWYLEYILKDGELLDPENFLDKAEQVFLAMKPFNDFLNRALKDFKMPERPR